MSRCWLRASAVESGSRVNTAMRGFTMDSTGNSASLDALLMATAKMHALVLLARNFIDVSGPGILIRYPFASSKT